VTGAENAVAKKPSENKEKDAKPATTAAEPGASKSNPQNTRGSRSKHDVQKNDVQGGESGTGNTENGNVKPPKKKTAAELELEREKGALKTSMTAATKNVNEYNTIVSQARTLVDVISAAKAGEPWHFANIDGNLGQLSNALAEEENAAREDPKVMRMITGGLNDARARAKKRK